MICVHVLFTAGKGREELAARELAGLRERSRRDPGCIRYDMHVSPDDPRRFMLYECWESRELLDAHLAQDHLAAFRERARELFAAEPEITFWNPF